MADPQKFKHRITILNELEILFLGIYLKELKARTQTRICTPVFAEALSTVAKKWRQPKCSSMDDWMMEYYLTLKKDILTTFVKLESIMLS